MAVSMTADQFHELTHFRLDQLWPERSGRAWKEVTMTIDQLEATVAALQTRPGRRRTHPSWTRWTGIYTMLTP